MVAVACSVSKERREERKEKTQTAKDALMRSVIPNAETLDITQSNQPSKILEMVS